MWWTHQTQPGLRSGVFCIMSPTTLINIWDLGLEFEWA